MPKKILVVVCTILSILALDNQAWAKLELDKLQKQASITAKSINGRLGIGVIDLQSNQSWYFNGNDYFPMQSVVKVVSAIAVLKMVDAHKLHLDQEIPLTKTDLYRIKHSAIADPISAKAKSASLNYLISRSICQSNNGTVDVLTRLAGGPAALTKVIRDAGIVDIRVDRYEAQSANSDYKGKGPDLLDSATPHGLCTLLYKLEKEQLLSAKSTAYLVNLMQHCQTGDRRIKAGFPKDWIVADKTGTGGQFNGINVAINDVAIISDPRKSKSKWILTVFIAQTKTDIAGCERKIAEIAHSLYMCISK